MTYQCINLIALELASVLLMRMHVASVFLRMVLAVKTLQRSLVAGIIQFLDHLQQIIGQLKARVLLGQRSSFSKGFFLG